MKKIILPEDLNNFVAMLQNFWGYYDLSNMTIVFSVDKRLLDEINTKLYHDIEQEGTPEETDEVVININEYKFIYHLEE